MFIKIPSIANSGLNSIGVDVEVNVLKKGLPSFDIVGLPAKAVNESKERVRAAIINSKIKFPSRKIIVNLAPADVPKEGSCYDLPIAVGILLAIMDFEAPGRSLFFGELSLDGSLRHTKGALLLALFARQNGFKNIFLPDSSANEASVIKDINIYPIKSLKQLVDFLGGKERLETTKHTEKERDDFQEFDMSEIIGQESAKRALEIAAGGGHNIFMVGGPGSGKTMLSRALPGILPLLSDEESLEVTKIYSASGNIPPRGSLIKVRPFRSPHHTISSAGLIGGGTLPRPGEITLAHRGVLFLDEMNEFQRSSLEAMRQPLEDGCVSISRSRERVVYPSKYMLVASANPCPCGYLNHETKSCQCTDREVEKYIKRVSGPLLDRVDMYIDVPDVETKKLSLTSKERENMESSKDIRKRVEEARETQKERFKKENILTNSEMKNKHIEKYISLAKEAEELLQSASLKFSFSARSYFKALKLSRTIADIDGKENVEINHVAEALQYKIQNP